MPCESTLLQGPVGLAQHTIQHTIYSLGSCSWQQARNRPTTGPQQAHNRPATGPQQAHNRPSTGPSTGPIVGRPPGCVAIARAAHALTLAASAVAKAPSSLSRRPRSCCVCFIQPCHTPAQAPRLPKAPRGGGLHLAGSGHCLHLLEYTLHRSGVG